MALAPTENIPDHYIAEYQGLIAMDAGGPQNAMTPSSDPFVRVTCKDVVKETEFQRMTLDPQFSETVTFQVCISLRLPFALTCTLVRFVM